MYLFSIILELSGFELFKYILYSKSGTHFIFKWYSNTFLNIKIQIIKFLMLKIAKIQFNCIDIGLYQDVPKVVKHTVIFYRIEIGKQCKLEIFEMGYLQL